MFQHFSEGLNQLEAGESMISCLYLFFKESISLLDYVSSWGLK